MHLLGFAHESLARRHQGRDSRATDILHHGFKDCLASDAKADNFRAVILKGGGLLGIVSIVVRFEDCVSRLALNGEKETGETEVGELDYADKRYFQWPS